VPILKPFVPERVRQRTTSMSSEGRGDPKNKLALTQIASSSLSTSQSAMRTRRHESGSIPSESASRIVTPWMTTPSHAPRLTQ